MKVVRKPDTSWWTWKFTCSECTAELEACNSDLEAVFYPEVSDCRPGEGSPARWTFHVTCPICTVKHQAPAEQVPKALQFEPRDRYNKEHPQPPRSWAGDR